MIEIKIRKRMQKPNISLNYRNNSQKLLPESIEKFNNQKMMFIKNKKNQ